MRRSRGIKVHLQPAKSPDWMKTLPPEPQDSAEQVKHDAAYGDLSWLVLQGPLIILEVDLSECTLSFLTHSNLWVELESLGFPTLSNLTERGSERFYHYKNLTIMNVQRRIPEPPDIEHQIIKGGIATCMIIDIVLLLYLTYYIFIRDEPTWPPNEYDCYPICPRGTHLRATQLPQCTWECEDKLSLPGIGFNYVVGGLTVVVCARWLKIHWNSR